MERQGTKGKCSNERGITLSTNYGKVYERVINERILEKSTYQRSKQGAEKEAPL